MSIDASISDTQRDQMFDRLNHLAGLYLFLLQMGLFFSRANTTKYLAIKVNGDETDAVITGIRISRCVVRSDALTPDTDSAAIVYATLVDGGSGTGHAINFYKDQARSVKVADLDATKDDGETGTIGPETGYQLAGAIDIGVTTGSNINFAFIVLPAPMDAASDQFDGTEDEDADVRSELEAALGRVSQAFFAQARQIERVAAFLIAGRVEQGTRRGGLFRRVIGLSSDDVVIDGGLSRNTGGGIVNQPSGLLEILRLAMSGNTAGSGAIKVGAATNSITVSFPGSWTGRDDGSAVDDRAVPGNLLITWVKGLDATPPRAKCVFTPTDARKLLGPRYNEQELEFELTLGQTYRSHKLGITALVIGYLPSVTNETGTSMSTTASGHSVTGLTTGNSTDGVIWWHYDGTDLNFYSTEQGRDDRDADLLIATKSAPSTGTSYTVSGDSGISITFTTGGALSTDDEGYIDYQPPTPTAPADYAKAAIAVTVEPGLLQRLFQRGFVSGQAWYLNSGSSPNVTDANLKASALLMGAKTFGDTP